MSTPKTPPNADTQTPEAALQQLLYLVQRLRAPDGCPWDGKQTPESFKKYLLEEAREVHEALGGDDHRHIREELGDLLFQIIFLSEIYREREAFTLTEVINGIIRKMVRRHPHVFGDRQVSTEEELRHQWLTIKAQEKREQQNT